MAVLRRMLVSILTWEARAVLRRYKPRIIAVTGSVGKTTTKDAIYATLSSEVHVRKSEKSFNSEIGVPLTILGLENAWRDPIRWALNVFRGLFIALVYQPYPQWLVLEVGADRPGDIRSIAKWLRPDIAVLTGVPDIPVHIEFFRSVEELVKEKRALAEYIAPGGKIVLNGDDPRMRELIPDFRGATITYGCDTHCDYAASHEEIVYENERPMGVSFRLQHAGSSIPVTIHGSLGRPKVYAALAAIAVADTVGVDPISASRSLSTWLTSPGRMHLIEGKKGSVLVDDTYNSSPAAASAALKTLRDIGHAKRKIAVLGDMLELGKYSADAHRAIGAEAAECASVLYAFGLRARGIAEGALQTGMLESKVHSYDNDRLTTLVNDLVSDLKPGDVILVKGSQGMRLEKVVKALMEKPEDAPDLLVRQDIEWDTR